MAVSLEGFDETDAKHRGFFASPEHEVIGRQVNCEQLRLQNGICVSFGLIIALAGDFYGVPEQPITPHHNPHSSHQQNQDRFRAAYGTLAQASKEQIEKEIEQIKEVMKLEEKVLKNECDSSINFDKKYDEITGGKWRYVPGVGDIPVKYGRMMKLAENNHDHFHPHAKFAYLAGHNLALERARQAGQEKNEDLKTKGLEEAHAIDAFACHFLTDAFASGHMRTPRIELPKNSTPAKMGHLLCKYMHDEDGKYGLRVTNARGDKWVAYGDGMLFRTKSGTNFEIVTKAVQASVDQVRKAFKYPTVEQDLSDVTYYIPVVDDTERNNYPMFRVDSDGRLLRRKDLNNLGDSRTTSNWWASTTVAWLKAYYDPHGSVIP